jgi:prepilin-type N-terminal cleavage/methylation domain-containing protein
MGPEFEIMIFSNEPNKRRLERCRAGMTLTEVVVALAVTGLAIAGIISGYNYCTHSAQKAALALAAHGRALARLEETRSAKWDTSSYPPVDQLVTSNFPSKVVVLDLSGSGTETTSATLETQIVPISTNPPLKHVRVDCTWTFRGDPVVSTIETFRAPDQ